MRVAFNPGYLGSGIDAIEEDKVRIEMSDPQRPVLVKGSSQDDFVYLLMPIRVS
jgi:DNA polymerase-3 subunit beta